jgi:hypothetical protein
MVRLQRDGDGLRNCSSVVINIKSFRSILETTTSTTTGSTMTMVFLPWLLQNNIWLNFWSQYHSKERIFFTFWHLLEKLAPQIWTPMFTRERHMSLLLASIGTLEPRLTTTKHPHKTKVHHLNQRASRSTTVLLNTPKEKIPHVKVRNHYRVPNLEPVHLSFQNIIIEVGVTSQLLLFGYFSMAWLWS